jgi:hypothetical protein
LVKGLKDRLAAAWFFLGKNVTKQQRTSGKTMVPDQDVTADELAIWLAITPRGRFF